jgi:putative tryptophan/tyrosine transport system substrate-binding protein
MKRIICIALCAMLLALCVSAEAQQAKKIPRIGFLSGGSPSTNAASREVFRQGLRELDYIEGQNITIEYRNADGKFDRLPALAAELVRLKVDVIVTTGNVATTDAKRTTTTIPIVMMGVQDPVSSGLVASLARPGANLTGFTIDVTPEQAGKNLELLKEAVPKVSRVAIPRRTNVQTHMAYSKEAERAAKILGITVQFAEVQAPKDKHLEEALAAIVHKHADALLIPLSGFFASRRQQIVDFAARNNLPAIYPVDVYVEKGGLMSYGPNVQDQWRRAAIYVDKILKGTKPADLPVEQPKKFEFIVNLKAAKQIGLTIPPNVLARADRVIR